MTASTGRAHLRQVQGTPGGSAANQIETLPFDQRHRDEVGLDSSCAQLLREATDMPFRPSFGEGSLDGEDQDAWGSIHLFIGSFASRRAAIIRWTDEPMDQSLVARGTRATNA